MADCPRCHTDHQDHPDGTIPARLACITAQSQQLSHRAAAILAGLEPPTTAHAEEGRTDG